MTLPMGRAMREVFGDTVTELANDDPRIVMLDGDLGSSTRGEVFQRAHPERFFQMGIAEQNMLGVAAGMASVGLIPYISTFVAFAVIRPLDQIRVLIAQPQLNVKITAGYSGLFTGRAGKTHQVVDDISIMRAMPNMVVVSPADDAETAQVLRWSAGYAGPVYIRLVRDATQHLFDSSYTFQFGAAVVLREGSDVTLISTGAETPRVVDAAEILATRGIQACVLHVPTIKPVDVSAIVQAAELIQLRGHHRGAHGDRRTSVGPLPRRCRSIVRPRCGGSASPMSSGSPRATTTSCKHTGFQPIGLPTGSLRS